MAFKDEEYKLSPEMNEVMNFLMGRTTSSSWAEHKAAVEAAELKPEPEEPTDDHCGACEDASAPRGVMDLHTASKVEKLNQVIHNTLNDLLTGHIALESSTELIDTINAVSRFYSMKGIDDKK